MQSSTEIVTTNKLAPSFLHDGCPSCHPTNSVRALKGNIIYPAIDMKLLLLFCISLKNTDANYIC